MMTRVSFTRNVIIITSISTKMKTIIRNNTKIFLKIIHLSNESYRDGYASEKDKQKLLRLQRRTVLPVTIIFFNVCPSKIMSLSRHYFFTIGYNMTF